MPEATWYLVEAIGLLLPVSFPIAGLLLQHWMYKNKKGRFDE